MRKQRAPTMVLPVAVEPRFTVEYSRTTVWSPISTQVSSFLYLRSCGGPPITVPTPICTPAPIRALQSTTAWAASFAPSPMVTLRADDGVRAHVDVAAQLGLAVDQGGGENHLSVTMAIISASATTCPSP